MSFGFLTPISLLFGFTPNVILRNDLLAEQVLWQARVTKNPCLT